jgi:asparagine synthase (glutamine-hydrolysing)
VGAFLSGGTDSSTVVALMQALSRRPVRTFTVGFHESAFQEAAYARSVARVLGTEHSELYVTPREAIEFIPELPRLYDEPFGDSSAIATFVISRFARQHVTVCLSGDGGDELFGGYTRYRKTANTWRVLQHMPNAVRRMLRRGSHAYARRRDGSRSGWRAARLAVYLNAESAAECYRGRVLQCQDAEDWVLGVEPARDTSVAVDSHGHAFADAGVYDMMMRTDTQTYLPDDILTKVDRASMGVSLEVRVPMLDHRVVEFAWRLPLHMKVRRGRGKWLLRRVLGKFIPPALVERPKMGFGVPVGEWVRGPLREWAEAQLAETRLRQEGLLDVSRVREKWRRHLNRTSREDDSVWQLLMFQSWLEEMGRQQSMRAT